MEIRPLNVADDAECVAVALLQLEEHLAHDPQMPVPPEHALRASLRHEVAGASSRHWVAVEDGRVLATAALLEDAVHTNPARLATWVRRDARRRGLGTALVRQVEDATGRAALEGAGTYWSDADRAGLTAFAASLGYSPDAQRVVRHLAWPVDVAGLERLTPDTGTYRVRAVIGDIPERYVPGYCALEARVWEDSPTGSLAFTAPEPDPRAYARMRGNDAAAGTQRITSLALTADDELAGFSDLRFTPGARARAGNGTTIVAREHRGHGLGIAMKVAGLCALAGTGEDVLLVGTMNEATNAHMVGINETLGYRVAWTELTFVRHRG